MKILGYIFLLSFLISCNSNKVSPNQSNVNTRDSILANTEQNKDYSVQDFYDFKIHFGSVCCGTTSIDPLLEFTENFLSSKSLQITNITLINALGKEGEYSLLFNAKNWSENNKQQFLDGLKKIHWNNQNDKSFGGVNMMRDSKIPKKRIHSTIKKLSYTAFLQL